MDVSIIIINYNTYELTCSCLKSLYQFNENFEHEIILVDNASTECDAILFKNKFPNINLVVSEKNLGFAGGNNLGMEYAIGNYILLLNSDTELIENSISICLDYMNNNKKVGVLSPKLIFPDGRHQSLAQRFPSLKYRLIELFRMQKLLTKRKAGKILLGAYFDHNETTEVDWVWGAFFMFRKEIISLLPSQKLDDSYFMYYEDVQWCMDIKKLGYEIHYLSDTKVIHRLGGSAAKKSELMKNNGKVFMKKNYNKLEKWILEKL